MHTDSETLWSDPFPNPSYSPSGLPGSFTASYSSIDPAPKQEYHVEFRAWCIKTEQSFVTGSSALQQDSAEWPEKFE